MYNPRLIIDFDKSGSPIGSHETRCDYLVIAQDPGDFHWVTPLEMKRGKVDATQVVKQLRAGSSTAEKLVAKEERVSFLPVVAHEGISKHDRKSLLHRPNRIRFHNQVTKIKLLKSGSPLVNVFAQTKGTSSNTS